MGNTRLVLMCTDAARQSNATSGNSLPVYFFVALIFNQDLSQTASVPSCGLRIPPLKYQSSKPGDAVADPMPLKLVFQQGDPCNTILVRSTDETPAYRSSTPFKLLKKQVTKITRIDRTGLEHVVAKIKWDEADFDDTEIALYDGEWRKIKTFMEQRKQFS